MQYGLNIESYRRVKDEEKLKLSDKEGLVNIFFILFSSFLASRVVLLLNRDNIIGLAPFGVAFLIAIASSKDIKKCLISSIGVGLGYITISNKVDNNYGSILSIVLIFSVIFINHILDKKTKEFELFLTVFISLMIYGLIDNRYDLGVNITLSIINTIVIIPITYVLKYGIHCVKEFGSNYIFSVEEMISVGLLICLLVSGIGDINIFGIEIRNIVANVIVLVLSYAIGGVQGTAIGVTMGIVVGFNSGDMLWSIAVYSIAGLIIGVFKDTGKIFSFLAYLIMFIGISLYTNSLGIIALFEVVLSGLIYSIFPASILKKVELELNYDKRVDKVNSLALEEVKNEFTNKIKKLGFALNTVSETLNLVGENENLTYNQKGTALVENLADRVCSKCINQGICWNREFSATYNSFQILLEGCEEKKLSFPSHLEKRCTNKFDLIKSAEKMVDNLGGQEVVRNKLEEGRRMLSGHVSHISNSINEMLCEFNKEIVTNDNMNRLIRRSLNKKSIKYKNIFCYKDVYGKYKIKVTMESCEGSQYCSKKILPIITDVMRKPMCVSSDGCRIDPKSKECSMVFEEMPKYYIRSYSAVMTKNGEEYTGDSYSFGKNISGSYLTLLSDGMGSGPTAGRESNAAINLVETFLNAGLSKKTTMDMINSITALKFDENENFSTLDLNIVDVYSGEASFIKVGAVASFIKRDSDVEIIESNMPPLGLLDDIEVEEVKTNVKNGDIIVMLSDGVLDIDKKNIGVYSWMNEFLKSASKDPKQLAEDIINKARELSGEVCNDDMTVVVSKVYSLY